MGNLKISVVVPVYNVNGYLEKCLDSIIGQTYTDLEIICVDDGSTDGSGEILDRYAKKDARIVVIHQPNSGVSTARNVALDHCTGDFVGFVDGDDWLEPNMYELLMGRITADDIDISACGYFEDEGNVARPVVNTLPVPEEPMDTREFLPYIYIRDQYRGVASYLWSRVFRREVIVKARLCFVKELRPSQDIVFVAQYFIEARKSVYTKRPMYHYVQRPNSVMHDGRQRLRKMGTCRAYQMIIQLYESNGIRSEMIDYVKRFYVYHASLLLKMAFQYGEDENIEVLKKEIQENFEAYKRTNQEHPDRIQEVELLLKRHIR